jgi:predicted MFS family arabinose efflux permease
MLNSLTLADRLFLGLVFAVASFSKVRSRSDFDLFSGSLRELSVLPRWTDRVIAPAIPAAEALIALLLMFTVTAEAGFVAATGLSAMFTAVTARVVRGQVRVACRCFGASKAPLGWVHVARNAALAVGACLGAAGEPAAPRYEPAAVAFALVIGGTAALVVTRLDDIASLFSARSVPGPH